MSSRKNGMAKVFGETSTTDEVLSGVNRKGKRVLVTGISAGIGVETARSLAAHGAHVIGTARDLKKGHAATDDVSKDAAANGGTFEVVALDLASLTSVRACADGLLKRGDPLDVIIANAGAMATPFGHTEDGFETQFGTNHLGHFEGAGENLKLTISSPIQCTASRKHRPGVRRTWANTIMKS
jgi:NAD(P)-dependent dehydrogenase (short-subunit alcohol dehydrogenase family)